MYVWANGLTIIAAHDAVCQCMPYVIAFQTDTQVMTGTLKMLEWKMQCELCKTGKEVPIASWKITRPRCRDGKYKIRNAGPKLQV